MLVGRSMLKVLRSWVFSTSNSGPDHATVTVPLNSVSNSANKNKVQLAVDWTERETQTLSSDSTAQVPLRAAHRKFSLPATPDEVALKKSKVGFNIIFERTLSAPVVLGFNINTISPKTVVMSYCNTRFKAW